MNRINIWGVKFDLYSLNDFVSIVNNKIKTGEFPIHMTGINPETVVHASKSEILRKAIQESDLVNVDNTLVMLTLRMLGYKVPERVATPDLFEALLKLSSTENYKIFILGAKEVVLNEAIRNILAEFPNLQINSQHGYYPRNEEDIVIEKIKTFKPDMLFIAMPSPEKESFILKYKHQMDVKLMLGVGGAVDCKANIVKRAPEYLRKIGLEGIHRAFQDLPNYGMRYVTLYPRFLKIVIQDILKNKKSNI